MSTSNTELITSTVCASVPFRNVPDLFLFYILLLFTIVLFHFWSETRFHSRLLPLVWPCQMRVVGSCRYLYTRRQVKMIKISLKIMIMIYPL